MNPQWQTFITISKMLDSDLPITTKIHKIIEVIIESIKKADAGFLLLWKEDLECLTIDAAVNFQFEYYKNSRILSGEGISGDVFKYGKSKILNSAEEINKAMENMRVKNKNYYLNSFVHYGVPKCCISVPIEYNHQRFGVLTLDNFLNDEHFTVEDLNFLQAIATQLAIAIKLSTNIQEKQQSNAELKLVLKNHHTLNQMILDGKNIQQLLGSLDELTKDEFFLFNSIGDFEFSTKNNSPLHNNLNVLLTNSIFLKLKRSTYQSIPIENTEYFAHIFIIASSFYVSGFLVFYTKSDTISASKKLILMHATSIIAIEKMKKKSSLEKKFQKRKSLLQLIKKNASLSELTSVDETIFFSYSAFSLLIIDYDYLNSSDLAALISLEEKINTGLNSTCITLIPDDNTIYCLVCSNNNHFSPIISFIRNALPQSTIFIGRGTTQIQDLFISYSDLNFLLLLNPHKEENTLYSYKELGIYRYLLQLSEKEKEYFIQEELGSILNEKNSRELLDTLYTYFRCQKNVSQTAKDMHLHINSIYYRLSQIEKKIKLDLSDFQTNINLYSALFLERIYSQNNKLVAAKSKSLL